MQRVALELHNAFSSAELESYRCIAMRSSWAQTHVRIGPFLLRAYRELKKAIEGGQVDAVVFSSMVTASLVVPLRKYLDNSTSVALAIVHGLDVTTPVGLYQRHVRKVFSRIDAVMPVSSATGDACRHRGLGTEKLFVVPNGIDVLRFAKPHDLAATRRSIEREFGVLPEGAFLLTSVGRLVARKGFDWFISQVMPLLSTHIHYWLAGEGPEDDRIRQAINDNGLQDRVRLIGKVSEAQLGELYGVADLFIMPNRPVKDDMEGFGVVILEAGLSGTPTIGARLEGIMDVISEDVNGHYVESGNARGFADIIEKYAGDIEGLRALSNSAASFTRETFGWDTVSTRYLQTISDVVSAKRESEESPNLG